MECWPLLLVSEREIPSNIQHTILSLNSDSNQNGTAVNQMIPINTKSISDAILL